MSQFSNTLKSNANVSEPLSGLVTSSYTSKNFEAFRRIMLALCLPDQVQLNIVYSNDTNSLYAGFTGICAKMLFSMSPGFRNITLISAINTDYEIGRLLTFIGFSKADPARPLVVASNRAPLAALWAELATNEANGDGWVNTRCNPVIHIDDPLYDGIDRLPIYGGIFQAINIVDGADLSEVPAPPIFDKFMHALEVSTQKRETDSIRAAFLYLQKRYVQFLSNLNRHIVMYGECGFRLSDEARVQLGDLPRPTH